MQTKISDFSFNDAVEYHYGGFPPVSIDYQKLAPLLYSTSAAISRYDSLISSLQNSELFLAPLRQQEAVISSRMEGTITNLDELLEYEAVQSEPDEATHSRHRADVLEVFSYAQALKEAQQVVEEGMPICGRMIKDAHRTLLRWGRGADKQPGEFKHEQNYIVDQIKKEVVFVPIAAGMLPEAFEEWERYVNMNDESFDPITQVAVSHVEFEALHPFKDGNGRVGRMLITLMFWNRGLIHRPHFYVSGALEKRRDEYLDRMRNVSKENAWTEWVQFFMEAVEQQALDGIKTAEAIIRLYEDMKEAFRDILHSQWTGHALDYVFSYPVFNNGHFKRRSGIPPGTAARFTPMLVDHGLLREVRPPSGRRPGLYRFEPLMNLIRV